MDSYFTVYKKELLLLAFAALALIVCTALFTYAVVKIVKRKNKRIRNARTMQLHSYMKLRNSLTELFFSSAAAIGGIFFIFMLFYLIKPEGFSLKLVTTSVATYLLLAVIILLLFSTLSNILYFFTTSVVIENEVIHIRYYLLRNYSICMKQVLSFSVRKGVHVSSLPVGCLKFTSIDGKKRKVFLYLSEESNIILRRYLFEENNVI